MTAAVAKTIKPLARVAMAGILHFRTVRGSSTSAGAKTLDDREHRRDQEDRHQRRGQHAADDRRAEDAAPRAACARRNRQRYRTHNERERSHEDRPKPKTRAV